MREALLLKFKLEMNGNIETGIKSAAIGAGLKIESRLG